MVKFCGSMVVDKLIINIIYLKRMKMNYLLLARLIISPTKVLEIS